MERLYRVVEDAATSFGDKAVYTVVSNDGYEAIEYLGALEPVDPDWEAAKVALLDDSFASDTIDDIVRAVVAAAFGGR